MFDIVRIGMIKQSPEDELEIAAFELQKAFQNFEKAAKKYMAIMDRMNKKKHHESKGFSAETQQIHNFLIKIMNDSSQIGERCYGFRCVIEKGDKQK